MSRHCVLRHMGRVIPFACTELPAKPDSKPVYACAAPCFGRNGDSAGAEGLIVVFDSCLYDRDTTKADIPLGNESDFAEAGSGYVTFAGEDYYVFQVVRTDKKADDSETFVFGKKPDGKWGIRMHTTGYASRQWRDGTAAYDGKRLALLEYDDRILRIIVYSEEGVLYQGTITTSLFLANDEHEWGNISGVKCYWK